MREERTKKKKGKSTGLGCKPFLDPAEKKEIVKTFRVNGQEESEIMRLAKIYKDGNVSEWVIEAARKYRPARSSGVA